MLFGTDGAGSRVRRSMQQVSDLQIEQDLLDAGYKQLSIPARRGGQPPLDPHALHVWPRGGYMMIAMPDIDDSFSAMLFLPRKGDHRMPWGFAELDSWTRQEAFMAFNFPDATPLIAGSGTGIPRQSGRPDGYDSLQPLARWRPRPAGRATRRTPSCRSTARA